MLEIRVNSGSKEDGCDGAPCNPNTEGGSKMT